MTFSVLEIKALTEFKPLTHAQLKQRESESGFAATLDELARADAAKEKPTGSDWWLQHILSTLKNQQPPPSNYELAKAENEARKEMNMAPNPDTLFTQYFEEELKKLEAKGVQITEEILAKLAERVQEMVEAEVQAWHEQQEFRGEESLEKQQLAQFDAMQEDMAAAPEESLVADAALRASGKGNQSPSEELTVLKALDALNKQDAEALLEQIRRAQAEAISWVNNR